MAEVKSALGSGCEAMADVTRALGKMQFDTEGGRVRATYEMTVERNKAVGNFTVEIDDGVTKAELGKEVAAGSFTREIGVTKPGAAGSFTGEISFTNAELGNKDASGSFNRNREIVVTKDEASSFSPEIGVAKVLVGNKVHKEAADVSTAEIGVTKAGLGNTEAGDLGVTKAGLGNKTAGTGMVTEASWLNFVFLTKPPEWSQRKTEPIVGMITKEKVPDAVMDILKKRRPFKKLPPISRFNNIHSKYPKQRDQYLSIMVRKNFCIDLHEDILKQDKEKGFAEVGVDFTDGVKKFFILP